MEQETSLLITQILALWGAVVSTLVAAWQFRDSRRQDGRLRLTIWVGRASSRLLKNSAKWDRQIDPVVLRCSQH